jgi:hypothetical protein
MKLPRPQFLLAAAFALVVQFLVVNYYSPLNNVAAPNWAINMTWGSTQYLFSLSLAGFWLGFGLLVMAAFFWVRTFNKQEDSHE